MGPRCRHVAGRGDLVCIGRGVRGSVDDRTLRVHRTGDRPEPALDPTGLHAGGWLTARSATPHCRGAARDLDDCSPVPDNDISPDHHVEQHGRRWPGVLRRTFGLVAALAVGFNAYALAAAVTGSSAPSWAVAVQGLGLLNLVGLGVVVAAGAAAQRLVVVACAAVLGVAWPVYSLTSFSIAAGPTTICNDDTIRVAAANLLFDNPSGPELVAELEAVNADVLVTAETLWGLDDEISEGSTWLPVAQGRSGQGRGVVLWTRDPQVWRAGLVEVAGWRLPSLTRTVGATTVTVIGVHLESPDTAADVPLWRDQLRDLHDVVVSLRGIVVLAGDFNASIRHPQMHPLLDRAADASSSYGRRVVRTWAPESLPGVRLLDLDHVLVSRNAGVCEYGEFAIPGSDHRGVQAAVSLLANPAPAPAGTGAAP